MMAVIKFVSENGLAILGGISLVLAGLYAIFLRIPGDQPDKALKAALDFTTKYSAKPAEEPKAE